MTLPLFARVHIPCIGGGSVFFLRYPGQSARLSDINERLINAYLATKADARRVAASVNNLVSDYERWRPSGMEALAQVHAVARGLLDEGDPALRAARMLFVVRWGFNGLYRENQKGGCNTPHGDARPKAAGRAHLQACSRALRRAHITNVDFEEAVADARRGDFVYFDPPFAPMSETASFTSYLAGGAWGTHGKDRLRLLALLDDLDRRGVEWTLSDSLTAETLRLYARWLCEGVEMRRNINRDGTGRSPVFELVVRNWGTAKEAIGS